MITPDFWADFQCAQREGVTPVFVTETCGPRLASFLRRARSRSTAPHRKPSEVTNPRDAPTMQVQAIYRNFRMSRRKCASRPANSGPAAEHAVAVWRGAPEIARAVAKTLKSPSRMPGPEGQQHAIGNRLFIHFLVRLASVSTSSRAARLRIGPRPRALRKPLSGGAAPPRQRHDEFVSSSDSALWPSVLAFAMATQSLGHGAAISGHHRQHRHACSARRP